MIVNKAKEYAFEKHNAINHRRKYKDLPYTVHLEGVVNILNLVTDDEVLLAAAWLHDVVEDTPTTDGDIRAVFGNEIADVVWEVTNPSKEVEGTRAYKKEVDRLHLATVSNRAMTLKLADTIHNMSDIADWELDKAKIFLNEKRELLKVLDRGDALLLELANIVLKTAYMSLDNR